MNDLSHMFTKYSLYYVSYIYRKMSGIMRLNKSQYPLHIVGWRSLFSRKMAAAVSFSFKIGSNSEYLVTLLVFVLTVTWSGYWASYMCTKIYFNFKNLIFKCHFSSNRQIFASLQQKLK